MTDLLGSRGKPWTCRRERADHPSASTIRRAKKPKAASGSLPGGLRCAFALEKLRLGLRSDEAAPNRFYARRAGLRRSAMTRRRKAARHAARGGHRPGK